MARSLARLQNYFQMRRPARFLDRYDFIEHKPKIAGEEMSAANDHVDFISAFRNREFRIGDFRFARILPAGEPRRHGRDFYVRSRERFFGDFHHRWIYTNRRDMRKIRQGVVKMLCLTAKLSHLPRRISSLQRRQIDHGKRELKRMNLRALFDAALLQPLHPLLHADLVDGGGSR
jgi:hypothetical protein